MSKENEVVEEDKASKISKPLKQSIAIFAMLGSCAWTFENNFLNLFIDRTITTDPLVITITTAASAVMAALTTLVVGTYLDKKGKRTPYMKWGYFVWGISILLFALINVNGIQKLFNISHTSAIITASVLVIIWDAAMTFLGSSCNDAAYNMWLTDNSNPKNRSRVEGFSSFFSSLGSYFLYILDFVGGFIIFNLIGKKSLGTTGLIGMTFNTYYDLSGNFIGTSLPQGYSGEYVVKFGYWWIFYLVLGLAVGLAAVFAHRKLKDAPDLKPNKDVKWSDIIYGFKPSVIKKNKVLYSAYLSTMLASIAGQCVSPFFLIYMERSLGLGGLMYPYMAVSGLAYLLGGYLFGILMDNLKNHKGVSKTLFLIISVVSFSIASFMLFFCTKKYMGDNMILIGILLMIFVSITSLATAVMNNVIGTTIRDYSPKGRIGAFQGIRLFVNVAVPMIVGPIITGLWNRNTNFEIINGSKVYYYDSTMFIFQGAIMLLVIVGYLLISKYEKSEEKIINN